MKTLHHSIVISSYDNEGELNQEDKTLLLAAKKALEGAYVPYSHFRVGAAVVLENKLILTGANQENASFPAGICAERVTLSTASAQFPGVGIQTIALTYKSEKGKDDHPISPCGICRQTLKEYENRQTFPIRIIMAGQTGVIYLLSSISDLLPLGFTSENL